MEALGDSDFFERVLVPLLWEVRDEVSAYSICESEAREADSGGLSVGRLGRNLTYGEVLPSSVERDVFRVCMLPCLQALVRGGGGGGDLHTPTRPRHAEGGGRAASAGGAAASAVAPAPAPAAAAAAAAASAASRATPPPSQPVAERGLVLYDLGSGTGKIPLQLALLALATGLPLGSSNGVEFARERHLVAVKAYAALLTVSPEAVLAQCEAAGWQRAVDASAVVAGLRAVAPHVQAHHGDMLVDPWPTHADAAFINNTVFEPALMLPLLARLAAAPPLSLVVTLRSLCSRHSGLCRAKGDPCTAFDSPAHTTTCNPTWNNATSLFAYTRVRQWSCSAAPPPALAPPPLLRHKRRLSPSPSLSPSSPLAAAAAAAAHSHSHSPRARGQAGRLLQGRQGEEGEDSEMLGSSSSSSSSGGGGGGGGGDMRAEGGSASPPSLRRRGNGSSSSLISSSSASSSQQQPPQLPAASASAPLPVSRALFIEESGDMDAEVVGFSAFSSSSAAAAARPFQRIPQPKTPQRPVAQQAAAHIFTPPSRPQSAVQPEMAMGGGGGGSGGGSGGSAAAAAKLALPRFPSISKHASLPPSQQQQQLGVGRGTTGN